MAKVASADGLSLYAEAHGEGPSVILSCALCTTRENWRAQVGPLVEAGFRVVLWDYRGHGRSDAPDDPEAYSMERVVDDLARVADWAAPGERIVAGGLSFGGLASLHYALRRPDRVRGLVLIGSGPGFKKPEAQAAWEASVEKTAAFVEKRSLRDFVDRAAATTIGRRGELHEARAAAEGIIAQQPHGLAHFARRVAGPAPPVIDELSGIDIPALVIVGEEDRAFLRAAAVMAERLPQAVRVDVAGAGHIVNIEESEIFNDALLEFLQSLPAPEGS